MNYSELINKAICAMKKSYSPYSHFSVGSAILCEDGKIYTGCNIENSSYPAGICSERVAIFKAISDKTATFKAIAIVGGKNGIITDFCYPCGICRQVMSEFCKDNFEIVLYNSKETKILKLKDVEPYSFKGDIL